MAPRTVILVPWRPSPQRQPLWDRVHAHLEGLGFPIYTADSDTDLFSLAQAFNNAADRPWDRAILSEADLWVPHEQVLAGLELDGMTWCYDRQIRFTDQETRDYLEAGTLPTRDMVPAESQYGSNGVRTITRELWDLVGGYDPRFVGWGGEDWDFQQRVRAFGEPHRIPGPLWELGHRREAAYYNARHDNRAWLARKHRA